MTPTACFACGHHHDPASPGDCSTATCLPDCPSCARIATTRLGSPIVVHSSTAVCDQSDSHEFEVVTDGYRAYAYAAGYDTTEFWREDGTSTIAACCPCLRERSRGDEPCDGRISVDLTTADWTADPDVIALLVSYSGKIDQP